MHIKFPELSLVVLVGASSSGKSSFAKKHFKPTEVISSDYCRGLVSDNENDMSATEDAFELLHYMVSKRLKRGNLTVVDATNVQNHGRQKLIKLAKEYHTFPVAIVLDLPEKVLKERHDKRSDRDFARHVLHRQRRNLKSSIHRLKKEGFRFIYVLKTEEEVDAVTMERNLLWNNKKQETGPFDIIGDVHGCFSELQLLLEKLDYKITVTPSEEYLPIAYTVTHPENRRVIFVGDLTDRGDQSPQVLRLVMDMVKDKMAYCVRGNHDDKLYRKLSGKNVKLTHGLDTTMEQLANCSEIFLSEAREFLNRLISHYVFDDGKLVVAHAGLREDMHGRGSGAIRSFAMYGQVTGEVDEHGMPVRYPWAKDYRGKALVVHGHVIVPEVQWLNNVANIDTACVFGGKLTALRYPERELVEVSALKKYAEPSPSFGKADKKERSSQQVYDDVLNIEDVTGKRYISTALLSKMTIREENSISALEIMSRFAINPKWLIYLPPTMSPTETSTLPNYLEYPTQGFEYYKKQGVSQVICEEKHMGSRAIVIICKNIAVAQQHFGTTEDRIGICYTRTGRNFFKDKNLEITFLEKVQNALNKSDFWTKLATDWVCLDSELMPWSAKAQTLIHNQYAAVGAAATHSLERVLPAMEQAAARGLDISKLQKQFTEKAKNVAHYIQSYQNYCSNGSGIDDLILAPFHVLATEGQTHLDKNHLWHINTIADFCKEDAGFLLKTSYRVVNLSDEESVQVATEWWKNLTNKGGEGMVIKPINFITKNTKSIIQPAVKCRGREYLRIIYGEHYTSENNLRRLKKRGLSRKRSLALREFALGAEALECFVKGEPLRRVHECVFGVLALESEEVDPRL